MENTASIENEKELVEVIGVRFRGAGKTYYFDPQGKQMQTGDAVIVETTHGITYGEVLLENKKIQVNKVVLPLRPIIRIATAEDTKHFQQMLELEAKAMPICDEKIKKHGLEMRLLQAEYTFDGTKLLFYFRAAGRVDFRELVKDLGATFHTRIELRQVNGCEEVRMIETLGICGRPLCCAAFLHEAPTVSTKMIREQNFTLNQEKNTGICMRRMCCLSYEYPTYEEELKKIPPLNTLVSTPDGEGVITEIQPLKGTVRVRITDKQDTISFRWYPADQVKTVKFSEQQASAPVSGGKFVRRNK